MALTRIEKIRRPIVNLSYMQRKEFYRESFELPLTLFRFLQH
jgi:hypothetical protein